MKITPFALCTASLFLWSCDGSDETQRADSPSDLYDATVTPPGELGVPGAPTPVSEVRIPQDFVESVASNNKFEIEASRKAVDHARSEDIRKLANNMVEEHEKAQSQLQTAIDAADRDLNFSSTLDPLQQANLDELDRAGDDFDTTFLHQQKDAHSEALSLLNDYAARGDIAALREHAEAAATVVGKHLQRITQLQAQNL